MVLFPKSRGQVFYRKRYLNFKALELFTQQSQSLTDLRAGEQMIALLSEALQTSQIDILLPNSADGNLSVRFSSRSVSPALYLDTEQPLVKWLAMKGKLLSLDELKVMPHFIENEKDVLEHFGVELLVPGNARNGRLSGLILLGTKLSKKPYDAEDNDLLKAFANQMAIKLENIALYEDALKIRR